MSGDFDIAKELATLIAKIDGMVIANQMIHTETRDSATAASKDVAAMVTATNALTASIQAQVVSEKETFWRAVIKDPIARWAIVILIFIAGIVVVMKVGGKEATKDAADITKEALPDFPAMPDGIKSIEK